MKSPIYLDYAATTPVDPRVAEAMAGCLTQEGNFGNPASRSHVYGWRAEEAVENARREMAELLNVDPREIVWTSGATESDNLAIKGMVRACREKGRHIVTAATEHKAVLDSCRYLESEGFSVTLVKPRPDGVIEPEALREALREDTVLVSLMQGNNETGVLTDIEAVGRLTQERGIPFHVDAAQAVGKVPLDLAALPVDLLSVSAHKLYGPKGVGALFVRRDLPLKPVPQMHGGGHERGLRSGTLPTHQIVGLGEAARLARQALAEEVSRLRALRDRLWDGIRSLEAVQLNGDTPERLPGHLNVSFAGVEGETLLTALAPTLAVSSGSACTSASVEPSHVLRAMGVSEAMAHSALRFTVGRFTREADITRAIEAVTTTVTRLREASPQWALYRRGVDPGVLSDARP